MGGDRHTGDNTERDDDKTATEDWRAGLPDDERLLAALGRVAIIQNWLHYAVRMWLRSLCDLNVEDAFDATSRQGFKELRQCVRELFAKRFGDGKPLRQLDALLGRAERATEERNKYIHGLWGVSPDGSKAAYRHDRNAQWIAAPTAAQVDGLARELDQIFQALNHQRTSPDGFLHELLAAEKRRSLPS